MREHRIEPRQRSRCFCVGLPIPQTDPHLMVGRRCFRDGVPAPQTGRHHLVRTRRGRTRSRRRATRRRSIFIDARRVAGGSGARTQAPLPWLRGAAFETRPPVADVMPRLRGTALLARVPVAEIGPWPKGTAPEARVPFVEFVPELRGTALAAQVPVDGTAPREYATDGVGARGFEIGAFCAALMDRLATGKRASCETK